MRLAIVVQNVDCCAVIFALVNPADLGDLYACDPAGNLRLGRCCKQQLVILPAVDSQLKVRILSNRERASVDDRRHPALLADVGQINGEAIAEVDHGGGQTVLTQPAAGF